VSGTWVAERWLAPPGLRVRVTALTQWRETLFHDLCSRPVVTSTHQCPDSRVKRLRAFEPPVHRLPYDAYACTRRYRPIPRRRRRAVAGGCDPRWCRVWATRSPAATPRVLLSGSEARMRLLTCDLLVRRSRTWDGCAADVPCHTPDTTREKSRASPWSAEDSSSRGAPTPRGCEPGTPSADRIHRIRPRFRGGSPDGRHCYSGLCAGAQLPTWVHAHFVRARSRGARLFAAPS
jgi:hypothetical protein